MAIKHAIVFGCTVLAVLAAVAGIKSPFGPELYRPSYQNQRPAESQIHASNQSPATDRLNARNAKTDTGKERNWAEGFFLDVKITDVLLAAFTGLLVCVGGRQARRLRETIETMRAAERAELRAYMGIEKIEFTAAGAQTIIVASDGTQFEDLVLITLKNYGQTPAHSVWATFQLFPTAVGASLPDGFSYPEAVPAVPVTNLIRSVEMFDPQRATVRRVPFPTWARRLIDDSIAHRAELFVYGRINYTDIYQRAWLRTFCYHYTRHARTGDNFVPYHEYNDEKCKYNPAIKTPWWRTVSRGA